MSYLLSAPSKGMAFNQPAGFVRLRSSAGRFSIAGAYNSNRYYRSLMSKYVLAIFAAASVISAIQRGDNTDAVLSAIRLCHHLANILL